MLVNHIVKIYLSLFLILNLVVAIQRAPFNVEIEGEGVLQERQIFKNSTLAKLSPPSFLPPPSVCSTITPNALLIKSRNLIWGLFRSKGIIGLVSQIPCEIVEILENDENESERFFTQIGSGEVPSLIENLPSEIIDRIVGIVDIALTLPSDIIEGAEAIVKDTVELFNSIEDGSIVEKLEQVPGMIVSHITSGWGDFTSGFSGAVDALTCAFVDCPITEPAGICLTTTTNRGESSTTAETDATPTFSSSSIWSWSPSPSPSPSPSWSPSPTPPSTYVPFSTTEGVATVTSTHSQTSTTLPSTQGSGEFTGLAASIQMSFKAAEASLIAALVGIIV